MHVQITKNHMATTFAFTVSCEARRADQASRALNEAHDLVFKLERELSEFLPESPVHALNRSIPGTHVRMSPAGIELLVRSERFRKMTGGAFDAAAKSKSQVGSPTPAVAWEASTGEAWKLTSDAHISFGAIGKGYALDRARAVIEGAGFTDFLLNAGGSSIVLSGFAGPGDPWRWGWSWSKDEHGESIGVPLSHPTGRAMGIGVSGTHEKGEHLIDSRALSTRNVDHANLASTRPLSSLVGSASAADADALSTALFVAGFDDLTERLRSHSMIPAFAEIRADAVPRWNGIFHHLWAPAFALAATLCLSVSTTSSAAQESADTLSETSINLDELGGNQFTPYIAERSQGWVLLPLFAVFAVLIHLKKVRRTFMKKQQVSQLSMLIAITLTWVTLEKANAVDLVPMGKGLAGVLGTPKAFKKTIGETTFFYSKDGKGKADKVAFIEKNIWQSSCTHSWIVGIGRDGKVTQIVAQEQQCPHARPSSQASFLDQYTGKGPADVAKLKGQVNTLAKATGSCELATDAVIHAITTYQKIQGQL